MRMIIALAVSILTTTSLQLTYAAESNYTAVVLKEAPPAEFAAPVLETLRGEGVRVQNAEGKPVLDFWPLKSIGTPQAPDGPQGAILYPFLTPGQLVGGVRVFKELGDYKDQPLLDGVYTARYGLQPINGDHLGISTHRDYFLLSLADEDTETETVTEEDLEYLSTGVSGTTHPSVLLLLSPDQQKLTSPQIVEESEADRTSVVVELSVTPAGAAEPKIVPVQIVIVGSGPV